MARGATARRTRSKKRAANRRQAQGVDEALVPTPAVDEVFSTRQKARLALVAAGVTEPDLPVQTTYELTNGSLADRRFIAEAIAAGYNEARRSSWPSEATLEDHGEVLFRTENEGVFRLDDGTLVFVGIGWGWCQVRVAAQTRDAGIDVMNAFSALYPPLYREVDDSNTVPITFWTNSAHGPVSRLRMIESASWDDIEGNYTAGVRDELSRLMGDFEPGKDGQLLLWQGAPGTGKTWALRALASEWRDWAEFSYITDPDSFFVSDPSYMIDVLLHESYETLSVEGDVVTDSPQEKWRVLILEDTGELLSANAKEAYGQGLSRLLNVVDGMVGQGLRVLALVTTNDELGDLHPAAVRPGRCASQIEFGPLSFEEGEAWLEQNAAGEWITNDGAEYTLAELYGIAGAATEEPLEFVDTPMVGQCANCDHEADLHAGEMNAGACTAEGCSCDGMVEQGMAATAEPEPLAASGATTRITLTNLALAPTFTPTFVTSTTNSATLVADAIELPAELQPGETLPDASNVIVPPAEPAAVTGGLRWTATLCPEGVATEDGRIFAPGAITWRELPLSLMAMTKTADGHDGAEVAGRIDQIWRDEASGLVLGAGEFDSGEFGTEIGRLVGEGTLRGVSVDIAVSEMEIAYASDVVDDEGQWAEQEASEDDEEAEGPSMIDVLFGEDQAVLFVVRKGIIGAATVCSFPAFADASIDLAASLVAAAMPNVWTCTSQAGWRVVAKPVSAPESASEPESGLIPGLTASAAGIAPELPPADWFEDPVLDGLTPLIVEDDGRVYGHAAGWDSCHIGLPGVCTTAPHSHSDYAYFHLKEVVCDDGARIACGTITLDAPHAGRNLGRADAAAHYDHTGTATADVVVGEDEFGIWVAGALRSDVDAEKARKLRGSTLSGDWRDVNGNLEMVGLLAVNVPGFPVPRTRALVASGDDGNRVLTLVAAGIHAEGHVIPGVFEQSLTAAEGAQMEVLADIAAGEYDALRAQVDA